MNVPTRWGPYTHMKSIQDKGPIVIERGEGVYVWDEQGKRYLDAHGGLWLSNIGYGRTEIAQAIAKQAEKISWFSSFGGFANRPSLDLADRVIDILKPDGMGTIFFGNDGSGAVETALKIARQYWKLMGKSSKTKLIGREHAYHGVSLGALSVAGITPNRKMFEPLLKDVRHAPAPYQNHCSFHPQTQVCNYGCVNELERIIGFEDPDTIAAFIAEPIQAAGGVIIPPLDYLAKVREICRKHNILFIADEVVTGFGRLGTWSGSRYYGIQPDMMTFAKGITSGYIPLGATAISPQIYEAFIQSSTDAPEFRHGNTYSGHPLACAAALANFDILEQEKIPENAAEMGTHFNQHLDQIVKDFPDYVVNAGSVGLLGRVELKLEPEIAPGKSGAIFASRLLESGIIVRPVGDIITLSPPLVINKEELDQMMDPFRQILASL